MADKTAYKAEGFTIHKAESNMITCNLTMRFVCEGSGKRHVIEGEVLSSQKNITFECPDCQSAIHIDGLVIAKIIPVEQKVHSGKHSISYLVREKK